MELQEFLSVEPDGIPSELKVLRQFVAWKPKWNAKKKRWEKVPIDPHTGRYASIKDPSTWGTLDEALARMTADAVPGIGFVFTKDDPYAGIDLDDVVDGESIATNAQAILDRFPTYRERSPSGTGVHVLLKCGRPLDGWKRQSGIEVYQHGRFFALTGRPVPGVAPTPNIADCTAAACAWHEELAPKGSGRARTGAAPATAVPGPSRPLTETDRATIASCCERWPAKFPRLYGGDGSDYDDDHSRADQALVAYLVKAGVGDPVTIDRIVRSSGLMRKKWNRADYRERTIHKALASVDPGSVTQDDIDVLRRKVARLERKLENAATRERRNGDTLL